jgi:hypothetical protein
LRMTEASTTRRFLMPFTLQRKEKSKFLKHSQYRLIRLFKVLR